MSDWVQRTSETLERAGYRASGPRRAVVEVLGRQRCVVTARDIADVLREEGRDVGLATIYRALDVLSRLGSVQRLDVGEGSALYEPAHANGEHHHHLVCDRCGDVSAFEDPQLERAIGRLAQRVDYQVAGHDVVLRGACPRCVA